MLACSLWACDSKVVFEENQEIPDATWTWDHPVQFSFEVADTVTRHNFYVNMRNGNGYEYSNVFLFITLHFPNGKLSIDTVECFLADPTGQWYGSGIGNLHDHRFLFKQNKQFPLAGQYKIEINQAMREEELVDIHDVGFRLSRTH